MATESIKGKYQRVLNRINEFAKNNNRGLRPTARNVVKKQLGQSGENAYQRFIPANGKPGATNSKVFYAKRLDHTYAPQKGDTIITGGGKKSSDDTSGITQDGNTANSLGNKILNFFFPAARAEGPTESMAPAKVESTETSASIGHTSTRKKLESDTENPAIQQLLDNPDTHPAIRYILGDNNDNVDVYTAGKEWTNTGVSDWCDEYIKEVLRSAGITIEANGPSNIAEWAKKESGEDQLIQLRGKKDPQRRQEVLDNLQPGDLLLFHYVNKNNKKCNHMAMFVGFDNQNRMITIEGSLIEALGPDGSIIKPANRIEGTTKYKGAKVENNRVAGYRNDRDVLFYVRNSPKYYPDNRYVITGVIKMGWCFDAINFVPEPEDLR